MKILHVMPSYIPAYRYGGPVKTVHELCRALAEKDIDVSVFTTNADQEKRLNVPLCKETDIDGVKVTYYPLGLLSPYYYSRQLDRAIRESVSGFDLVHAHSVFLYPPLSAAYWCRNKDVPYIINPFGALDPDMLKLKNTALKKIYIRIAEEKNIINAEAVHVASEYEKKQFLSLGFDRPVEIVPRGLNIQDYKPKATHKDFRQRYPQLKGKSVILFLGRLHFKKGLDMLAEALKDISGKRKDVCMVIAGPGESGYTGKIKALFNSKGLKDKVIFTGMVLGEDKLAAFHAADIFVLPSYGENFGITVLEAMACGVPVVITDKVGLSPDVEEYKAGIVTECNPKSIADASLRLLEDKGLRSSSGQNGMRLVEDRFNWDKVADEMIGVYTRIITNHKLQRLDKGD